MERDEMRWQHWMLLIALALAACAVMCYMMSGSVEPDPNPEDVLEVASVSR